jgi:hypothetical protein
MNELDKNIIESNNLYELDPTEENYELLMSYKNEKINIDKEQLAGIIFRSKCQWAEHGEKIANTS